MSPGAAGARRARRPREWNFVGTLEAAGGGWAGGASHGPLSVEGCAAACLGAAGCSAFSVSDGAGCETYHGQLQGFTAVRSPIWLRAALEWCALSSRHHSGLPFPLSRRNESRFPNLIQFPL